MLFMLGKMKWKVKLHIGLFGGHNRPYVAAYLKRTGKAIIGYLQANTYVLAESYGTGSFMLSDNPGLRKYMKSIGKNGGWNPARRGKAIVGRPKGQYTNLFGQKRSTSGAFAGDNIEGKRVYTRKKESERDYYISPTRPSYAIQLANNWLWKTYLPRAFKNAMEKVSFTKYLIES